jgi:outer membrane protein TolC
MSVVANGASAQAAPANTPPATKSPATQPPSAAPSATTPQPNAPAANTPAAPQPAAAAPANQNLQPSAAVKAPPQAGPETNDTFDLTEALRGGKPYTSKEIGELAVKTAPSVARAEAAAQRAEAAAEQAEVAVWPRLELEARYTRVSPVTAFLGQGFSLKFQENQGLFQARLSWPVSSLFFVVIPRHQALMKAAESQQIQSLVERQTIKLRAREAYYAYARARAASMVAKATLAQTEAHRKDSDALVSAGSIARVELMRAEAQVAAAKVALVRADTQVAIARDALYTLIHIQEPGDITVSENIEEELPPPVESQEEVLKRAIERRSELRALTILSQSQERQIAAARGQALPVIAIGGTAEEANPNQRYLASYEQWKGTWQAFASLVWTPNDTFSATKQIDIAKAEYAQTQQDLASLKDALRVEVSQAYNGFQSAHVALEAARSGIAAAEESYRVRREQFRAGAAIAVDVIDAEAQLRQARLDLANTLIDLRVAKARLDRAVEAD